MADSISTGEQAAHGSGDQRDGIVVPEHFVPTPVSISPQAQAFLRMKLPFEDHAMPAVGDIPAWQEFRKLSDAGIIQMSQQYLTRYPCKSVTHQLSESQIYEVIPDNLAPENRDRVIYYIHGGGFTGGGGEAARVLGVQMAGMARCRVYSMDYRLAPEFPFPAPLDDTLEGYRHILKSHKPENVGIFGPSAGANLAAAVVLKARDLGAPMPAACAMHSCPSDMYDLGDSANTNFMVDIILRRPMPELHLNYAGKVDPKDPYMSPVYGDFARGFPPSILTSGTRDLLLSNTVRQHRAMVRAGVTAELHVWEAMTHAPFFGAPEEEELYMQHIEFMFRQMG